MASVEYLIQGIAPSCNHEDAIKKALSPSHNYDQVIIYSAFCRSESVRALENELKSYGPKACVIIGIRNGSTSKQGLEALIKSGVDLYAVDTGSPLILFHPKAYIGINHSANYANAVIGSANFTPGGFNRNIENSCIIKFNLSDKSDCKCINDFIAGKDILLTKFNPDNVVHITSVEIINDLFKEGRITDESSPVKSIKNIGINMAGKKIVPRMALHTKRSSHKPNIFSKSCSHTSSNSVILKKSAPTMLHEVWRSGPLSERDLTIPKNANTNPTGSMLLKKGMYDIDFQSYFRDTVFHDLSWQIKSPKKPYFEYADAKFYFIIDGIEYPAYTLTVQFDTRTDTKSFKQRNGTTHLHWGAAKSLVKNRALLGKSLYLYRIAEKNDEYVIEIKSPDDD